MSPQACRAAEQGCRCCTAVQRLPAHTETRPCRRRCRCFPPVHTRHKLWLQCSMRMPLRLKPSVWCPTRHCIRCEAASPAGPLPSRQPPPPASLRATLRVPLPMEAWQANCRRSASLPLFYPPPCTSSTPSPLATAPAATWHFNHLKPPNPLLLSASHSPSALLWGHRYNER